MRSSGILLHITSLPSSYGIGAFGSEAERFVDWLEKANQKFWQILPLTPTGYGNSPYQSFSTFAGNPLLIDLDDLVKNGMLSQESCDNADYGADPSFVDFEKVERTKIKLLEEAFSSFKEDVGYLAFVQEEAHWLEDYSIYMALKELKGGQSWTYWEEDIRYRKSDAMRKAEEEHIERIKFWKFVQYTFLRQWRSLRKYANKKGIEIIGDLPIYVSADSADVWANPELFQLDSDYKPTCVAGVPPDYFSETGQLWGNPLYRWDKMKEEGYIWWKNRVKKAISLCDYVRIDHFRAFDTYYSIPAGNKDAKNGSWEKGPGMDFFNSLREELGEVKIIAEDLGEIFDSVRKLLQESRFPGMRILQFGFNPNNTDNDHLPHNYPAHSVVYTGTHDNSTINGWYKDADRKTKKMARNYLSPHLFEPIYRSALRALYSSASGLVIIPIQDVLNLDDSARMNVPSTVGKNWIWRMKKNSLTSTNAKYLNNLTKIYFRG